MMTAMAWRIEKAVAHGEIDNTVEGHTTGRIWLVGREEPLILSLDGDCWRDLAGTRLEFENPSPMASPEAQALDTDQSGIIGDMTASRKNRVPTVSDDKIAELYQNNLEIPCVWRNTLYLEWFSEINGRVVIESAFFRMTISDHEWQMDEDSEEAQKLANLNAMRDFMAQIIQRRDPDNTEPEHPVELDEFAWEERLKESDRLTDAYQEVMEKYNDDSNSEQKEAFVMGWDGLLDALAERDEKGGFDESYHEEDELLESEGDETFDDDDNHPIQVRAQELSVRAMDVLQQDDGPDSPSDQLISNLLQVSGKLAGVLHGRENGHEPEAGFVLAVLKRCLNWLNEAIGACQILINKEKDRDQLAALNHILTSAFEIRQEIVELRRQIK
jgi:hypothetical protein